MNDLNREKKWDWGLNERFEHVLESRVTEVLALQKQRYPSLSAEREENFCLARWKLNKANDEPNILFLYH